MKRELWELQSMQALPLNLKVKLTQQRIREWVNHYGEGGVYVSFSGGKDSTVLFHLVREMFPNVPAVFYDTGLEYPEIRQFVKTFDNVEWIKPKMTFKKVIEKYGYPFISKEVSERVYYAQRYWRWLQAKNNDEKQAEPPTAYGIMDPYGVKRNSEEWKNTLKSRTLSVDLLNEIDESWKGGTYKIKELLGQQTLADGTPTQFDYRKWKWLVFSPFIFGNRCCQVMKKGLAHSYTAKTGKKAITGQQANESRLRTQQWLNNGCNGFDMKAPISNPMSFWLENDILQFVKENGIKIASVYGDVVEADQVAGQITWDEFCGYDTGTKQYTTTGCKRTGCMFCGYGCHLEKPGEGRFELMKQTHPKQYEYIMKPWDEGGLGYKDVIDWLNEHGDLNIRY